MKKLALLVLIFSIECHGTESLFESDTVLEIELRGPVADTIRSKSKSKLNAFKLAVDGHEIDVNLSIRGKSRIEYCRFPPLRLDFSNSATEGTPFAGEQRLKLVTHCKATAAFEQNVLEEYAAYQVFAMLSDVALRVRLLRIRYVDTDKRKQEGESFYGFLIESEDGLANRVGGTVLKQEHSYKSKLNAQQAARVFVFQYFVGNTDWSLVTPYQSSHCCHNGVLIDIDGSHHIVPYDFDQSGLVSAAYARPDPRLRIRNVRTRLYRGVCTANEEVEAAVRELVDLKPDIVALVKRLPYSSDKPANKALAFLERFFDKANDDARFAESLEQKCAG